MVRERIESDRLANLQLRLDAWREHHGGRGRRIPEALWQEAAEIAVSQGLARVARVLRLRRERLEQLVGEIQGEAPSSPRPEFIELDLPATDEVLAASVWVQFEGSDGRRLQLLVPSTSSCDVGALFTAFVS